MKKFIFLSIILGILFVPHISQAQPYGNSEFKLVFARTGNYKIIFDRKIYDIRGNSITISGIVGGIHRLVVQQHIGGPYGQDRRLFDGEVDIPGSSLLKAKINRYNRFVIVNILTNNYVEDCYDENNYYNDDYYNQNNWDYYNNQSGNNYGNYHKPILDIARLERAMDDASFEKDKSLIAEQAISTHRVSARQIHRILQMFNFESTKLEMAKFAYKHCIDKHNYYEINKAFSFSSSIRELNEYIRSYKDNY